MNGFLLIFPFLAVRFGLLSSTNKNALQRAKKFAPVQGQERIAYDIYQASNIIMFLYLIFLQVRIEFSLPFYIGIICYVGGLSLCAISLFDFSSPDDKGLNINGFYQFSRNPMYVAYFICFIGMPCLTQSVLLFGIIMIFQISAHWIILSEERWCIEKFGESYLQYMKKIRRYI